MPIGRVKQVALADRQGVIVTDEDGVTEIYRYSRVPDVTLEVGDYVRGEIYGFTFAVLYRLEQGPCPVFHVDFKSGIYTKEYDDGKYLVRVTGSVRECGSDTLEPPKEG